MFKFQIVLIAVLICCVAFITSCDRVSPSGTDVIMDDPTMDDPTMDDPTMDGPHYG